MWLCHAAWLPTVRWLSVGSVELLKLSLCIVFRIVFAEGVGCFDLMGQEVRVGCMSPNSQTGSHEVGSLVMDELAW